MLQAVALSGEVDFTPGPDRRARLGGARFNWLSRQLPAAAGVAGDCSFDVGLAVGRLTLPNGLQIVEPQLRLRRWPAAAAESFPAIEFTVVACAVDYAGIELAVLKGAGALGPDAAWLKGSAKLAGQPFSYSFELRQVEDAATGAQCAGAFALGTLRLRDLVIPAALAGNQPVRVTGDLEVEGTMRLSPAGEWEIVSMVMGVARPAVERTPGALARDFLVLALDLEGRHGQHFLERALAAFGALLQRRLTELLQGIERVPALLALIVENRHRSSLSQAAAALRPRKTKLPSVPASTSMVSPGRNRPFSIS